MWMRLPSCRRRPRCTRLPTDFASATTPHRPARNVVVARFGPCVVSPGCEGRLTSPRMHAKGYRWLRGRIGIVLDWSLCGDAIRFIEDRREWQAEFFEL